MIELEIKQILTKMKYQEILEHGDFSPYKRKQQMQLNYYYDTVDYYLYRNDITLRVRQIENTLKLEIKLPLENRGTYKAKQELAKGLLELPKSIVLKQAFNELEMDVQATFVNSLITERTSIVVNENVRIDLDKSSYLGVMDYELEIEFKAGFYEEAYQIYKIFFPSDDPVTSGGKKTRFFERYFKFKEIDNIHKLGSDSITEMV